MALLQLSEFHSLKQSVLGTQALQLYRTTKTSETEESAFSGHESHVSTLQQDITACSEVMFRLSLSSLILFSLYHQTRLQKLRM